MALQGPGPVEGNFRWQAVDFRSLNHLRLLGAIRKS
jgi:hypothetical protein